MNAVGKDDSPKKKYVAPRVEKVDLSPEGVTLGFSCKAAGQENGVRTPYAPCSTCGAFGS